MHAAGKYYGDVQESIMDYAVSSYTPTLTNILPRPTITNSNQARLLMVGQADSPGQAPLPYTDIEINEIAGIFRTHALPLTCNVLKDELATRTAVLSGMANSNIVHLACHGTSEHDSLRSAIVLQDGPLDVQTMIRTPFADAQLAFLSACQTAFVNLSEPDESIHIASAMLFAGFKGVIGTMWAINDEDAPIIAKSFYTHLIKNGTVECSDAAVALHNSVKEFRGAGSSVLNWAPFIHLGL